MNTQYYGSVVAYINDVPIRVGAAYINDKGNISFRLSLIPSSYSDWSGYFNIFSQSAEQRKSMKNRKIADSTYPAEPEVPPEYGDDNIPF